MADHFYHTVAGAMAPTDVTVTNGSSGTTGAIELRIHDGDGTTKLQVLNALEAIENYITRDNAPA